MRARVSLYTRCTSTKLLYSCITPYVVFALHRSSTKRSRYDYILENVDSQQFWIRGYGRERETRFWRNAKIAKYRRGIPSSCERIADGCRRPTGPVPPSSLHPLASLHPAASCVTSLPTLDPPSLQRLPFLQRYHLHPPSLSPPRSPLESARLHSAPPPLSLSLPSFHRYFVKSIANTPPQLVCIPFKFYCTRNNNNNPWLVSTVTDFTVREFSNIGTARGCVCSFPGIFFFSQG